MNRRTSTARDRRPFGLGTVIAEPLDIIFHLFLESLLALVAEAVRNALPGLHPYQTGFLVIPVANDVHGSLLQLVPGGRRRGTSPGRLRCARLIPAAV
jgi:hypothetical protein